jgi:hypothetical protein
MRIKIRTIVKSKGRFWASPLLLRRLQPHRKCAAATKAKGFLFYSYLHANICFPRFWLARMKACPCFCAAGKRVFILICMRIKIRTKVHFVLICSLCLEAPAKRSSNKNTKNAKVKIRKKCNRGKSYFYFILFYFILFLILLIFVVLEFFYL